MLNKTTITEVTLTGNQNYSTAVASKTNWRLNLTTSTNGVAKEIFTPSWLSDDYSAISLPQQVIRTFNVSIIASEYNPPAPVPAKTGLPPWAIALISVGGVLIVGAASFLIYKKVKAGRTEKYLKLSNANESDVLGNNMS